MRLPPQKSGGGSSVTSTYTSALKETNGGVASNGDDADNSLQELLKANFSVLEDNINDIIAFEEAADKKQQDFDQSRKMYSSPSERFMMSSSPQTRKKNSIKAPSPILEAKKRLSLSSDSSWRSNSKDNGAGPPKKRMSLTSDSSWMKSAKETNDGAVITPSTIRRNSVHSISSHHSNGSKNKPVPSNKLVKKPSERALHELKELTKKFESDMKIDELREELELASKKYEIFGSKAPFGIDDSQHSDTLLDISKRSANPKRISFQKDLPESLDDSNALGAIKEVLTKFQSSLQEYTDQQEQEVSESGTEDTSKDNHLTKEIDTKGSSTAKERRLSDVTLDTAISNEKGKRPSHIIVTVEDAEEEDVDNEENMKVAKDLVYANAGKSMQGNNNSTPIASGGGDNNKLKEKRKFGKSFSKLFKAISAWIQRRIEAFVASFTPKEKMIVKHMG